MAIRHNDSPVHKSRATRLVFTMPNGWRIYEHKFSNVFGTHILWFGEFDWEAHESYDAAFNAAFMKVLDKDESGDA